MYLEPLRPYHVLVGRSGQRNCFSSVCPLRATPPPAAALVLVSSDPGLLAERLRDYQELGFESLYLHPVGEDDEFIEVFGAEVLSKLGSPA